jgi:hypothetical protein
MLQQRLNLNPRKRRRRSRTELKIEPLNPKWLNNLLNNDYLLVSVQGLGNQGELMDISWREKNWSSILRKLIRGKSDLFLTYLSMFVSLNVYL